MPGLPRAAGRLARALGGVRLVPAHLNVWRAVVAGRDPRDASRSALYAGRWHDPRVSLALYTAEDDATAVAELRHRLPAGHEVVLEVREFTLVIPQLLDLTNLDVVAMLPVRLARCLDDTPLALRRGAVLGGAAFRVGADAIRAPSVRGPAACVCFFEAGRGTIVSGASASVTVVGEAVSR